MRSFTLFICILLGLLPVMLPGANLQQKSLKDIYRTGSVEFIPQMVITVDTFQDVTDCRIPTGFTLRNNRLYILDLGTNDFKIADRSGKYIKTVGGRGRGPADLFEPLCMEFAGNRLAIWEMGNRRFSLFTPEGKFIKSVTRFKKENVMRMKALDNKRVVLELWENIRRNRQQKTRIRLKLYSPDLEEIRTLYQQTLHRTTYIKKLDHIIPIPFPATISWDVLPGNKIVYGMSDKYALTIEDTVSQKKTTVTHRYKPIRVTQKDKEYFLKNITSKLGRETGAHKRTRKYYKFPDLKPPFEKIVTDADGNILVFSYSAPNQLSKTFDAFDCKGNFINRVEIKSPADGIHFSHVKPEKGNVFWVSGANDEDRYYALTKYKVK